VPVHGAAEREARGLGEVLLSLRAEDDVVAGALRLTQAAQRHVRNDESVYGLPLVVVQSLHDSPAFMPTWTSQLRRGRDERRTRPDSR